MQSKRRSSSTQSWILRGLSRTIIEYFNRLTAAYGKLFKFRNTGLANCALQQEIDVARASGVPTTPDLLKNENIHIERRTFFKLARIASEWMDDVPDPESLCKLAKGRADVLTFWERLPRKPNPELKNREKVGIAAIPLVDYDYWWNHQIGKKTRNMVRKASKNGVEVKIEGLTDELVHGMEKIYNETSERQGRHFTHYGQTFEHIKEDYLGWIEHTSHRYGLDFLVAYYGREIIGFIQLVYAKDSAHINQILSKKSHWNRAPNNLLIDKAVKICCGKGIKYLIYGRMTVTSLGKFKQNNGLIKMNVPRYYIPLSKWGKIICYFKMYRGFHYYYYQQPWLQNIISKLKSLSWMLRKRS
ncbi:MAG: peptidoglycan bridge formation glycyltransferase FemA/FemB family protein [Candidatus Bathyarchaeota archaeon]|jgi:hypothetical protein